VVTALLVIGPVVALGITIPLLWGHAVTLLDIVLAVVLYVITGHGITVGYHRLFTHSSFKPTRPLKIVLATLGSLAVEGRMAVLHHVTWSINSVCHVVGRQPYTTKDHSTNFAPLAILSFGESWHNFHHAQPCAARHGAAPHQIDSSARVIRVFEQFGWATNVRWSDRARLAASITP
jgi:fatty-acid desaturase